MESLGTGAPQIVPHLGEQAFDLGVGLFRKGATQMGLCPRMTLVQRRDATPQAAAERTGPIRSQRTDAARPEIERQRFQPELRALNEGGWREGQARSGQVQAAALQGGHAGTGLPAPR